MLHRPPISTLTYTLFPYPTLSRSYLAGCRFSFFLSIEGLVGCFLPLHGFEHLDVLLCLRRHSLVALGLDLQGARTQLRRFAFLGAQEPGAQLVDRKSTRLNSSH